MQRLEERRASGSAAARKAGSCDKSSPASSCEVRSKPWISSRIAPKAPKERSVSSAEMICLSAGSVSSWVACFHSGRVRDREKQRNHDDRRDDQHAYRPLLRPSARSFARHLLLTGTARTVDHLPYYNR